MNRLVIGIVAHVDSGKTTLSEGLLYTAGAIRKMGRVDNKDAYLDTFALERERGITIFSKQAELQLNDLAVTLLDTPGHVDFSAEMERTLQVLDAAILVVSGADGIQGHTKTLWRLLKKYKIPVFIFVNKMDQQGTDQAAMMRELKGQFGEGCIDFSGEQSAAVYEEFYEEVAVCDENLLEQFLENDSIDTASIKEAIAQRKIFPCFFGSALKLQGVKELLQGLDEYAKRPEYPAEFGARVYKISRDEQGKRVTHLKVTGGTLKVREMINPEYAEEKVNQIRIYSGEKFHTVNEVPAGTVCAVTGLVHTLPGQGIGIEKEAVRAMLSPVLTYQVILPDGCDALMMLPKLRQLEEEDPELHVVWNEALAEIQVQIMGEVQLEILTRVIQERFGVAVTFGSGNIVYKETIANVVEGVGHYEPLRHYAEVHLLMEPLERGSGMQFATNCSTDDLDRNWQRLIMTHLQERAHLGVLTGSEITDIKITLVSGRAHQKHTEGGDFREATYRAVRQGLMQADSVLLEPYYNFVLELPQNFVGRALSDMDRMNGTFEMEHAGEEIVTIRGYAPVSVMREYQTEVVAYTKGYGRLSLSLRGYEPCHNTEEVIEQFGYDAERDTYHPTGSVFCAHGSGFFVNWDHVREYMHLESYLDQLQKKNVSRNNDRFGAYGMNGEEIPERAKSKLDDYIAQEEIEQIFSDTFNRNKRDKSIPRNSMYKKSHKSVGGTYQGTSSPVIRNYERNAESEHYLLVDGYNIIFAWPELNDMAKDNIDGARGRLLDIMCNYQGIRQCNLIVVFDAYRVQGHKTEVMEYHNIHVVYTKEAETADQYIEKFAHENGRKHYVTVATSDGLEQIIIRGQGCLLISAREFEKEVKNAEETLRDNFIENQPKDKHRVSDMISKEMYEQLQKAVAQDENVTNENVTNENITNENIE